MLPNISGRVCCRLELGSTSASCFKTFNVKHLLDCCQFRVCLISPVLSLEQGGPFQHRRCTEIGPFLSFQQIFRSFCCQTH